MAPVTLTVPEAETETEATPLIRINEALDRLIIPPPPPPASLLSRLAWLWRRCFCRLDPSSIPVRQALTEEQLEMVIRHRRPGYWKRLAMDREVAMNCLQYYNLKHPGNEYEPAPGKVYGNAHFHNGMSWTHGNFVARKKRADEPVTESYSVLGFPLGFSTRRSGKLDCFCKTCYKRFDLPHPVMHKIFACGHQHVQKVCEMCYLRSPVLHPRPGGFAFSYHDPYRPYPTKHSCHWEERG